MREAFTRRDWEGLTAALAPTFNADDHRLLGWGTTIADPATYVRSLQALADLAPDFQVRIEHLRFSDGGSFAHAVQHGTRDGGAFETPILLVAELDGAGLVLRWDVYDVDDYERARARFDALTANTTPTVPTPFVPKTNAATATMERIWAALDAGDLGATRALCATDFQWDDRRPLVGISGDVELMIASARERLATGARLEERVVIGTAGDRVAIARALWAGGPPEGRFEVEYLALHEVDEAGVCRALIFFDVDDELAARREARDRWFAIDPVAAAVVGNQARFIDAWNDGDRARVRATLADDLIVDDHRRTGMGRIDDVEVYVDSIVALWQLAPDAGIESWSWLAVEPHGMVFVGRRTGRLPEGGAFESEYLAVSIVRRGLVTRLEMFEVDAVDAALARFAELRPDLLRIPPNAATRANDLFCAYCRAGDWERLRAHYHPACVFENRRRLLRTSGGVEMAIANAKHLWGPGVDAEQTVLATAGDSLALQHWRFTGKEGDVLLWERESLTVAEVDAEGRIVAVIIFDVEDRAAASDELAERHARMTFPPAATDRAVEMIRARRSRDLARIRAALPTEFHLDDHRRTGLGRIAGAEAYTAALAALFEQSPDVTVGVPLHYLAAETYGALCVTHTFGTLNDGGAFESVFLTLALYGDEGTVVVEAFELEDLDRARARFEELRPDPLRVPRTAATQALARSREAIVAGDLDAVRALVRSDFVFEDRGKRALVHGDIETWLGSMQFTLALPEIRIESEVIATLGDRIALQRMVAKGGPEGGEFELLHRIRLFVADAAGKVGTVILFDLDDRKLALVEALDRFAAGEAAETGGVAPFAAFIRALAADDWEAARRTLAPDFVLDDHRTLGLGRLDRDQWIASMQAQAALRPGLAGEVRRILAWNRYGLVAELRTCGAMWGADGAMQGGGPFENVFPCVVMTTGNCIRSNNPFDLTDTDRALARFAELSAEANR
jgi:ketosteroid isomerase-like protein